MIIFRILADNQDTTKAPREVAEWLNERNQKYPDVTFQLSHHENGGPDSAMMKKYSRFYSNGKMAGVLEIVFPYVHETWNIRMIGMLPGEKRDEIAGLPDPLVEEVAPGVRGRIRQVNEPVLEKANDLVNIE